MSSSNNNFNGNLNQTPIGLAYQYNTHSEFIKNMKHYGFSNVCSFCSSRDTVSLVNDDSFRQCKKCNKQFKSMPLLVNNKQLQK
jgi:hypothetical protein